MPRFYKLFIFVKDVNKGFGITRCVIGKTDSYRDRATTHLAVFDIGLLRYARVDVDVNPLTTVRTANLALQQRLDFELPAHDARTLFDCPVLDQFLDNRRVCKGAGITEIVQFIGANLAQDSAHDLPGTGLG